MGGLDRYNVVLLMITKNGRKDELDGWVKRVIAMEDKNEMTHLSLRQHDGHNQAV